MRGSGRSGRFSSAGGVASSTRQISPSAGATTSAGAGGRDPGRVAEERGVGARRQQAGAAQPPIPAARRGDRKADADERQAGAGASEGLWFAPAPPVARGLI